MALPPLDGLDLAGLNDVDGDGEVSAEEREAGWALVDAVDQDGDGWVSDRELSTASAADRHSIADLLVRSAEAGLRYSQTPSGLEPRRYAQSALGAADRVGPLDPATLPVALHSHLPRGLERSPRADARRAIALGSSKELANVLYSHPELAGDVGLIQLAHQRQPHLVVLFDPGTVQSLPRIDAAQRDFWIEHLEAGIQFPGRLGPHRAEVLHNRRQASLAPEERTRFDTGGHDRRPVAVVLYAEDDPNFDLEHRTWEPLLRSHRVLYYEWSGEQDILSALEEATASGATPAQTLVIGGHGWRSAMRGSGGVSALLFEEGRFFDRGDEAQFIRSGARKWLAADAAIVLETCNADDGGSPWHAAPLPSHFRDPSLLLSMNGTLAETVQRIWPQARVIAAQTSARSSELRLDSAGRVSGMTYRDDEGERRVARVRPSLGDSPEPPPRGFLGALRWLGSLLLGLLLLPFTLVSNIFRSILGTDDSRRSAKEPRELESLDLPSD